VARRAHNQANFTQRHTSWAKLAKPEHVGALMIQEQVFIHIGISVALVSHIERGDISTPDIQNRYLSALAATLKLRCDLQLKIA
jgi:hypothetical protein